MNTLLQAQSISKAFPRRGEIFSNLSLQIEPGDSIAITGSSGSGKSTLLYILAGLEAPDSGEIFIQGQILKGTDASLRRRLGFVFQSSHLIESETLWENLILPARISGVSPDEDYAQALLQALDLSDTEQMAWQLSGGQKQRLALARALLLKPCLLFADEPTGNLDQEHSQALGDLLIELAATKHSALILATHDFSLAKKCKKVFELQARKLKELS